MAVWLFSRAGLRRLSSALIVMVTLAVIEYLQIHLPGRTVELTDPILAGLLAVALSRLS